MFQKDHNLINAIKLVVSYRYELCVNVYKIKLNKSMTMVVPLLLIINLLLLKVACEQLRNVSIHKTTQMNKNDKIRYIDSSPIAVLDEISRFSLAAISVIG